jgi:hypothetical protein
MVPPISIVRLHFKKCFGSLGYEFRIVAIVIIIIKVSFIKKLIPIVIKYFSEGIICSYVFSNNSVGFTCMES